MPPRPRLKGLEPAVLSSSSSSSTLSCQCRRHIPNPRLSRSLSSTAAPQVSRARREFYHWLGEDGAKLKQSTPGTPNYLGVRAQQADLQPFPANSYFTSCPVLSDHHKETIWKMVKQDGISIREVSNLIGVEMNRIGAVVRLKAVELEWAQNGKKLENAYHKAIMDMVPVAQLTEVGTKEKPIASSNSFEPINPLPIHRATKDQIFVPAAESRTFTRADAGAVFEHGLLPVDKRIPHPESVEYYQNQGSQEEREAAARGLQEAYASDAAKRKSTLEKKEARRQRSTHIVEGDRALFKFTSVVVDEQTVGKDGRGERGVGARYGLPHEDRKKGAIKIPTRV